MDIMVITSTVTLEELHGLPFSSFTTPLLSSPPPVQREANRGWYGGDQLPLVRGLVNARPLPGAMWVVL